MSEGFKIALTAVAGIAVFIAGQIIMKWFIEPIQEQRKLRGKIIYGLAYYANVYAEIFPRETVIEASTRLRDLASQLQANASVIPFYGLLSLLHMVPKSDVIMRVSAHLIDLSNHLAFPDNIFYTNEIIRLLKIKTLIRAAERRNEQ